jgi:hypothetical protein
VAQVGFAWLVGPMEITEHEVTFGGEQQVWASGVKIQKCRYLEGSGCVGMCTNMCKVRIENRIIVPLLPITHPLTSRHFDTCIHNALCGEVGGEVGSRMRNCHDGSQIPTQKFFCETFGIPLTMSPNFEDLSCQCVFGAEPPPLAEDPCYSQPCFTQQCECPYCHPCNALRSFPICRVIIVRVR